MDPDDALVQAYAEILSAVSHDLRNPLGTLSMAAASLGVAAGADPDEPRAAKLRSIGERVQRQTARLARIVDNLADFAALEGGRLSVVPMPYDATAVLDAAAAAARGAVGERGMPVTTAAASGAPAFTCDLARASQIVANLAGISAHVGPRTEPVELGVGSDGGRPALTLACALPDLDDAALATLFARTWRSPSPAYRSAGLALAVARGIAESHGGAIRAERAGADRARFVITFGA